MLYGPEDAVAVNWSARTMLSRKASHKGEEKKAKSHSIERKHETHTLLLKMQAEIEIDRG